MPAVDDQFDIDRLGASAVSRVEDDEELDRLITITTPVQLQLVRVSAGEFLMGSNPAQDDRAGSDEQPQHGISLDEYYIGKFPVTNAQYAIFVQATKHRTPLHWKRLFKPGRIPPGKENHPVIYVSWHDAVAFCDWLTLATGRLFRLPTEAEWEKGARGPYGQLFPWGNVFPTPDLCNFSFHVNDTTAVDKYSPRGDSPYGCADMAGNTLEWTQSLFKAYPYDAKDGREDPRAAGQRVLRGGARHMTKEHMRCAFRGKSRPNSRYEHWGFRVALCP